MPVVVQCLFAVSVARLMQTVCVYCCTVHSVCCICCKISAHRGCVSVVVQCMSAVSVARLMQTVCAYCCTVYSVCPLPDNADSLCLSLLSYSACVLCSLPV